MSETLRTGAGRVTTVAAGSTAAEAICSGPCFSQAGFSVATTNSSATAMVTVWENRSQALRIARGRSGRPLSAAALASQSRMAFPARAPLALTMGDACGVGPEIIARWFRSPDAGDAFVVGDVAELEHR